MLDQFSYRFIQSQALGILLPPVFAIVLSLLTALVLFSSYDINGAEALYYLLIDPVRDFYGISELLLKASPIVLCGLGLLFCFRAGIWNIGAEGQFIAGTIAAGWTALALSEFEQPGAVVLVLISGVVGGLVWAGFAGLLKAQFNANEVLTTIMMNYIAIHLLMFVVNGPLKDPSGFSFPESAVFESHTLLPLLHQDYRINIAIFLPVLLAIAVLFIVSKTRFGFEIDLMGANRRATRNAGISENRMAVVVLAVCGAFAGLAGATEVAGPVQQLIPQLSLGYGYAAIIAIYLSRMHPIGLLLSSLLLGMTYVGAENLQLQFALPSSISSIFQGLILFYLIGLDYLFSRLSGRCSS